MKSDIFGLSTCQPGEEQYEFFYSKSVGDYLVQYDYRTKEGKLFSTVASTMEKARHKCRVWCQNNGFSTPVFDQDNV